MLQRPVHLMFDIDGTLTESCAFDSECYEAAIAELVASPLVEDRNHYRDVSDEGILRQHLSECGITNQQALIAELKTSFVAKIGQRLKREPARAITGARRMLDYFGTMPHCTLSLATGGWLESAKLKLASAGLNVNDVPIASSNDHFKRTEIMRCAYNRAGVTEAQTVVYIGDGLWDKRACAELGWPFVLVGNKCEHRYRVDDYSDLDHFLFELKLAVNSMP
ncbi:HAD family hydrolase [Agaribacterium haliotis]|uniref:HAD family hydrolase n=1 Tax=Agaribacterium haliotis TaxID=2013869 RepID=UPI000BB558BF|nr:HAD hydrolase-like protein [Agaribacterium haliotis]